jgi:hypothetical protein
MIDEIDDEFDDFEDLDLEEVPISLDKNIELRWK